MRGIIWAFSSPLKLHCQKLSRMSGTVFVLGIVVYSNGTAQAGVAFEDETPSIATDHIACQRDTQSSRSSIAGYDVVHTDVLVRCPNKPEARESYRFIQYLEANKGLRPVNYLELKMGSELEVNFNDVGRPVLIRENDRERYYVYDKFNRLAEYRGLGERVLILYEAQTHRVRRLQTQVDTPVGPRTLEELFDYNRKGQLVRYRNTSGARTIFGFTHDGLLRSMRDERGRTLTIDYNDQCRPERVYASGLGEMWTQYASTGEIAEISGSTPLIRWQIAGRMSAFTRRYGASTQTFCSERWEDNVTSAANQLRVCLNKLNNSP